MIIEDDRDDQELLEETFSILDYPNPIIFFSDGNEALKHLLETNTPPVLIISDINMPKISGLEVRERINGNTELQKLQIPYVFFTTSTQKATIVDAYNLSAHGFFTKPNTMAEFQNTIKTIVEYWLGCYTPGLFIEQTGLQTASRGGEWGMRRNGEEENGRRAELG
jgi:CheY-like chemotaxis protein